MASYAWQAKCTAIVRGRRLAWLLGGINRPTLLIAGTPPPSFLRKAATLRRRGNAKARREARCIAYLALPEPSVSIDSARVQEERKLKAVRPPAARSNWQEHP